MTLSLFHKQIKYTNIHYLLHPFQLIKFYVQVWTCARDGLLRVWEMAGEKEIIMVYEWQADSPVKSACLMADGVHMCTGLFDGSVLMWDIRVTFSNHATRKIKQKRPTRENLVFLFEIN
jgi:hypothetical protein